MNQSRRILAAMVNIKVTKISFWQIVWHSADGNIAKPLIAGPTDRCSADGQMAPRPTVRQCFKMAGTSILHRPLFHFAATARRLPRLVLLDGNEENKSRRRITRSGVKPIVVHLYTNNKCLFAAGDLAAADPLALQDEGVASEVGMVAEEEDEVVAWAAEEEEVVVEVEEGEEVCVTRAHRILL